MVIKEGNTQYSTKEENKRKDKILAMLLTWGILLRAEKE